MKLIPWSSFFISSTFLCIVSCIESVAQTQDANSYSPHNSIPNRYYFGLAAIKLLSVPSHLSKWHSHTTQTHRTKSIHHRHGKKTKPSWRSSPIRWFLKQFSDEAGAWYGIPEFNVLARNINVPGLSPLFPQVHCTVDGEICQLITGEGGKDSSSPWWESSWLVKKSTQLLRSMR